LPFALEEKLAKYYFKVIKMKADLERVSSEIFSDTLPVHTYSIKSNFLETPYLSQEVYQDLIDRLIRLLIEKDCYILYLCHIELKRSSYLHMQWSRKEIFKYVFRKLTFTHQSFEQYKHKRLYQWILILRAAME